MEVERGQGLRPGSEGGRSWVVVPGAAQAGVTLGKHVLELRAIYHGDVSPGRAGTSKGQSSLFPWGSCSGQWLACSQMCHLVLFHLTPRPSVHWMNSGTLDPISVLFGVTSASEIFLPHLQI